MNSEQERYIPALSFDRLTALYDPLMKWVVREEIFRHRLIEQAALEPGMWVLDVGTGTGTLPVMIKQAYPAVHLVGIDGDPAVLRIARAKAARAGVRVEWWQGLAGALPLGTASVDRVMTSLMLHHLTPPNKHRALSEMWLVLRPGGQLLIVDFGVPHSRVTRGVALVMRHLEETATQLDGQLPTMMSRVGFTSVEERDQWTTLVGPLTLWWAVKPGVAEAGGRF